MTRIFISYARKYEQFARRLAAALSDHGAEVWLDVEDIPAGMNWSRAIQAGLDQCQVMLVIVTPESMESPNVENEWQYYIDEGKPVIPIKLVAAKTHFQLRRLQYIDFEYQTFDAAFAQLHRELRRLGYALEPLAQPVPEPPPAAVVVPLPPPPPPAPRPAPAVPAAQPLPDPKPNSRLPFSPILIVGVLAALLLGVLLLISNQNAQNPSGISTDGTPIARTPELTDDVTQEVAQAATNTATPRPIPSATAERAAEATAEVTEAATEEAAVTEEATEAAAPEVTAEATVEVTEPVTADANELSVSSAYTLDIAYVNSGVSLRVTVDNTGDTEVDGFTLVGELEQSDGSTLQVEEYIDEVIAAGESLTFDIDLEPPTVEGGVDFALEVEGSSAAPWTARFNVEPDPNPENQAEATSEVSFVRLNPDILELADARPLLAFSSSREGDSRIYVMDEDGDVTRVTDGGCDHHSPAWSPDGEMLVFITECDSDAEVMVLSTESGELHQLTFNEVDDHMPYWASDNHIYVARHSDDGDWYDVYAVHVDGTSERLIPDVNGRYGFSVSPDASQIAYVEWTDDATNLFIYDMPSETAAQVSFDDEELYSPAWSRDGSAIAYLERREDEGVTKLLVYTISDNTHTALVTAALDTADPSWSVDGQNILYAAGQSGDEGGALVGFNPSTGNYTLLEDDPTARRPVERP